MSQQHQVDQAADRLVEQGVRVTARALRDAMGRDGEGEPGGGGATRDLVPLLTDWKRRRRYREHLAVLEISEDVERVLAAMATALAAIGVGAGPTTDASDPIRRRLDAIAVDIGILRDQVGAMTQSQHRTRQQPKARREGRKRGLAAVMGRLFWDRMMQHFAEAIRKGGPMTAAELLATLDSDALEMAEAAFERIDPSLVTEKVEERVRRGNYFRRLPDGRYDTLRRAAGVPT